MICIMKTFDKISILCIGLLLLGCAGSKDQVPGSGGSEEVKPVQEPETRTLTFVLPTDGYKTAWKAGDAILIHGEFAKNQVTVTLTDSDISSDGKTASCTVSGLYPYVNSECASTLYAAWPAEAVDNIPHCFFYTGFKSYNSPLLAACNDSQDNFEFKNLSCELKFKVEGDFDTFSFSGRKDTYISYEYFQAMITDQEQNVMQYKLNPIVTVNSAMASGTSGVQHLYLPGSVELPAGFIIKFFKNGEAMKSYTSKAAASVTLGGSLDIEDITSHLEDFQQEIDFTAAVNLAEKESANCYIVTEPGIYKIPTVQGNSAESVGLPDNAVLLWETWCTDQEVTKGSIIKAVAYEGGYLYFQTADTVHPGNALIGVMDEDEKILWSWHIWVPETPIASASYGLSTVCDIMSRNLGALIDTAPGAPADPRSFGLLYQWGRKDPFVGAVKAAAKGSEEEISQVAIAGKSMTLHEGRVSQAEAAAMPTTLISVSGVDWCSTVDKMYWGDQEKSGTKTVYDPCPAGYRAPGRKRVSFFETAGTAITGWSYDADNFVISLGSPVTTIPICGYVNEKGKVVPGESVIWNTHMDADQPDISYCFLTLPDTGSSKKGQMKRYYAASLRCEKVN